MKRATTIEAYNTIKANGLLGHLQEHVYSYLFRNGPCTAKEIDIALTPPHSNSGCYTTRLSELRDRGVVKEVGTKRCKTTGRNVIVWDVTDSLPSEKPKKETSKQVIEKLKKEISYLRRLLRANNISYSKSEGFWKARDRLAGLRHEPDRQERLGL